MQRERQPVHRNLASPLDEADYVRTVDSTVGHLARSTVIAIGRSEARNSRRESEVSHRSS
jgi:hypothetical protein